MKKTSIIVLIIIGIMLIGCTKGQKTKFEKIIKEEIFSQEDTAYFVCFVDDSEDSKETINILQKYANDTTKGKKEYNVYYVDNMVISNQEVLDDVTNAKDLSVTTFPTLIKVYTSNGEKKSMLVGKTVSTIEQLVNGLIKAYKIKYSLNGGKFQTTVTNKFNECYEYVLPTPVKDGYTFGGWQEKRNIVTTLDAKDYTLEAVWVSEKAFNYIEDKDIFKQAEETYLVYFIKDGCTYCQKTEASVLSYSYLSEEKNTPKIYVVNLKEDGVKSSILRTYSGSNGQGDDKDTYVNGLTVWNELYIPATPTLIEIKAIDNQKQSFFLTTGTTNIQKKLNQILSDDGIEYTMEIDLGYDDKKLTYTFKSWEEICAPELSRTDYVNIFFEENGQIITNFAKKNYNLKAIWARYEYLDDEKVFQASNDDKYLIYFMKDDCTYCEKIKLDVLQYIYLQSLEEYNYIYKLYVVNLKTKDKTSSIYKKNEAGDDVFVEGAQTVDELYVTSTPTLIEIDNGKAKLISKGASSTQEALQSFLNQNTTDQNEINFNLDGEVIYNGIKVTNIPSIKVYSWQEYSSFPTITREGYYFAGWMLDGEIITSTKGQTVTLEPKWISEEYYHEIKDYEIFNQKETKYLVYFMKDGCAYCEKTKASIISYIDKSNSSNENALKLYIVNLKSSEYISSILRTYSDADDGTYVNGVTLWSDLYISSTPTLIEIAGDTLTAELKAIGTTNVINALQEALENNETISVRKEYTAMIDYGYDNKQEIVKFYDGNNLTLPEISRDGYIFIGYSYNNEIITSFENKNYELKVVWAEKGKINTIKDTDVFNQQEESYYIVFITPKMAKYEEIIDLIIKYQNLNKDKLLYVVDISNSIINRAYNKSGGEGYNNKFYCTKAREYDELYIYATPSIIEINKNNDNRYIGAYSSEVISYLTKIIGEN